MTTEDPRARTGIAGLDDILSGGLTRNRLYLVEGMPGSGKTTLAFQFLMQGRDLGEEVLYVTLSETRDEIESVAQSHGWDTGGVQISELVPPQTSLDPSEQYSVFHPSEVELSDTTEQILEDVKRIRPRRLVLDSLSELRLLAGSPLKYRRQILALKQYFAGRDCTVILLDDLTAGDHDLQVQSIAHGALLLEQHTPMYGQQRRRLRVLKYRGSDFRGGYHDYTIRRGGLAVFPRLVASEHTGPLPRGRIGSGQATLDALLGGGIEYGSSTLLLGPAGSGKSSVAALFAQQAADEGGTAALFVFDERRDSLIGRMTSLGVDMARHVDAGRIVVRQVDPAELSPGEMTSEIRRVVTEGDCRVVVIDSLNGYLQAMPDERFLIAQLHELLTYLGQKGVATIMINAQQGLIGPMKSVFDASYLADSVVMTRYFESDGAVRMAISVLKKRGGPHERTIRELIIEDGTIRVGDILEEFRGVLTGTPVRADDRDP